MGDGKSVCIPIVCCKYNQKENLFLGSDLDDEGGFLMSKSSSGHFFIRSRKFLGDLFFLVVMAAISALACGCGDSSAPSTDYSEDAKQPGSFSVQPRLVLYNWEAYLGEDTLQQFEDATGIFVDMHVYGDDEEMLGAIQSGSFDGDVLIVSESVASEMAKAKLLSPLDMAVLPNAVHIDPLLWRSKAQEGEVYSFPYLMGTTGIVVNTKHVPEPHRSWKVLWDERFTGRLAMLNNPFEVIGAASLMLGHPLNPKPEQLKEVHRKLLEQKPLLAGYMSYADITEKMVLEELWAAQVYSNDALLAMELNPDLAFVFPEEGCVAWTDVFVVPVLAKNKVEALAFINFMHQPEIMGEICSELWSATPNVAAKAFIDPEVLDSSVVYPPDEVFKRCAHFGDMGDEESVRRRLKIWAELLADD
ncbi:MAG TPA: spermidine/putrescine ABC transporter substrate-binding protein [Desulfonatronum sp.]|nr:spermidine/putrescine ABC transporter substrate-binding protein [Desulfonatronum sp.]